MIRHFILVAACALSPLSFATTSVYDLDREACLKIKSKCVIAQKARSEWRKLKRQLKDAPYQLASQIQDEMDEKDRIWQSKLAEMKPTLEALRLKLIAARQASEEEDAAKVYGFIVQNIAFRDEKL